MVVGLCVDFSFSFVFVLFLELCFFGIVFLDFARVFFSLFLCVLCDCRL